MSGATYWKGQVPVLLLQLAGMAALAFLLLLGGVNGDSVALFLLLWALVAALWMSGAMWCGSASWTPF